MMHSPHNGLWIYIDHRHGQVETVSLQLLTYGKQLAKDSQRSLVAVVVGDHLSSVIQSIQSHGADYILVVEEKAYSDHDVLCYTHALCTLAHRYQPSAILIGATAYGRQLAPRLSCVLETGLSADCTMIKIDEQQPETIIWTRPAMGGQLMADIVCKTRPQMGTVRTNVFTASTADHDLYQNKIISEIVPSLAPSTQLLGYFTEHHGAHLDQASIIVAGGLGMINQQNFALLDELAQLIGGTVGATKGAVDGGLANYHQQIGQSGKTVAPDLYIACGISGAAHHLCGITSAKTIIAINKDPHAPIFKIAHYGLVEDASVLLPLLIQQLKSRNNKPQSV